MSHRSPMTHRTVRFVAASMLLAAAGLASCNSDAAPAEPVATLPVTAEPVPITDAAATPDGSASPTGSGTATALTGAEICERLMPAAVAAALGVEVTGAAPDDASTPQCAYSFTTAGGASTNATVAFLRPDEDLSGRLGDEAFDYVVGLNQSIAGADTELIDIDAGDDAVRLSGPSLHLGVVRLGDRVFTIIVAAGDAPPASVDLLVAAVADTFA